MMPVYLSKDDTKNDASDDELLLIYDNNPLALLVPKAEDSDVLEQKVSQAQNGEYF